MRFFIFIILTFFLVTPAFAKLGNKISENEKKFGDEIVSKDYSDSKRNFSGKKVYKFPLFGWQLEVLYIDGKSISEVARPKGNKVMKEVITEREANIIADILYPRDDRGPYRKQIKNANFISHFFEHGVVSLEMKLDKRRKKHIGIMGVRTVLYSNGAKFKDIKVNAYH